MSLEDTYQSFDFIKEVAKSILGELEKDNKNEEMLTIIEDEYNQTESYPKNTFSLINKAISGNDELITNFLNIYNSNNENMENLYNHIFFYRRQNDTDTFNDDKITEHNDQQEMIFQIESADPPQDDEDIPVLPNKDNFLTLESLQDKITKQIEEISKQLSISKSLSYLLLKKFNWNSKYLIEKLILKKELMLNLLKNLHVSEIDIQNELSIQKVSIGDCPFCYSEKVDLYKNYCGHLLCFQCWKDEIEVQLNEAKMKVTPIHCRYENCGTEIFVSDVLKFCGEEKANEYIRIIIENQTYNDKKMIKCPAPNCNYYIIIDCLGNGNVATCKCGKQICWFCHQDAHSPLKCGANIDKWNHVLDDINNILNQQNLWVQREYECFEYRISHIDEIMLIHSNYIKKLENDHKERSEK